MLDFYSDTQTRATRSMREAILDIELGDERHHQDPSTLELCERVANILGMEKAMLLPSGTMANEIAIAVHCQPGDEIVCTRQSHIIFAESGGPAALSGVMMNPIDDERGMMTPEQLSALVRRPSDFAPRSRLVIAEQTSNLGGGAIWPKEQLNSVVNTAKQADLATHLDGARLMNAVVETGISAKDYAQGFDSAWLGFTKGLGCPVGAVLAGNEEFIKRAWLFKRRWGGAMRQTGVLSAMCIYALDHHLDRLADDHTLAKRIGKNLEKLPGITKVLPVETNIVIADLDPDGGITAQKLAKRLREKEITITVVGAHRIRIVTHLDVSEADGDVLIATLTHILGA